MAAVGCNGLIQPYCLESKYAMKALTELQRMIEWVYLTAPTPTYKHTCFREQMRESVYQRLTSSTDIDMHILTLLNLLAPKNRRKPLTPCLPRNTARQKGAMTPPSTPSSILTLSNMYPPPAPNESDPPSLCLFCQREQIDFYWKSDEDSCSRSDESLSKVLQIFICEYTSRWTSSASWKSTSSWIGCSTWISSNKLVLLSCVLFLFFCVWLHIHTNHHSFGEGFLNFLLLLLLSYQHQTSSTSLSFSFKSSWTMLKGVDCTKAAESGIVIWHNNTKRCMFEVLR